ncbi:MAG: NACHT domain-containing protein [Caldilineaceae bacterium]|nr:NACHT domain-containing protein [Caldilineaceae bacterium]
MNPYLLHFFGPGLLLDQQAHPVAIRSQKQLALLVYLASEHQTAHSRETLLALLWPDKPRASAQNMLRFTLSHLRSLNKTLAKGGTALPPLIVADRQTVQLHPAWVMRADTNHFQQLLASTRQHNHTDRSQCAACQATLRQAVALYQGEFLGGFSLDECAAFEEWIFMQREQIYLLVREAYRDLAIHAEATDDLTSALTYVQQQIALDSLCEPAYRQQMRILHRQGERSAALAIFERCRSLLNEDLGLDPEPETLALHMQILAGEDAFAAPMEVSPAQIESPSPAARVLHNLPHQLTQFIGREAELTQLQQRLQGGDSRLISLVGQGGIGKTRLALQIAASNLHLFGNGVFFVPLAGVQDASAIPATIMDALGLPFVAGAASPAQQLLAALAERHLLLVIDNFEQLMDGVDLLLDLLQAAPQVTLLVTTREQLNCQAEDLFELSGLAVPGDNNLADAGNYAAVRLFCERAHRLHKKTFKLTEETYPDVVQICQLVEGMPLAIELATTWLGHFTCADLAAALAENQPMLATTQRDLPARHRSMQTVFDHSWQMLSEREQQILSQIALCQGRFSAQIATQLTGASLLDLTSLRYKSFLRIADAGYYDLHPLIRSFALATLDATTLAQTEDRLATLYLGQVAAQQAALEGATPQEALLCIGRELDNIQQAWEWAVSHRRSDLLLQGVAALGGYYTATGRNAECAARFLPLAQRLMAAWDGVDGADGADEVDKLLCAHLLDKVCHALQWLGKLVEARKWAQTMVAVAQTLATHEQELVAQAFVHWGKALDEVGRAAEAVEKYEAALTAARQLANIPLIGNILIELSHAYRALDKHRETEEVLLESLRLQHSPQGNRLIEQRSLLYLSVCKRNEGDFQGDRSYLIAAADLSKLTGNRHVEMRLLDALGINYGLVGNYQKALEYHGASHRIAQDIHQPVQESHTMRHMCTVHRKLGNLALAEDCGLESLRVALAHEMPLEINCARIYLGLVWLAADKLAEAHHAFQLAYEGWQAQGAVTPSWEAIVGLAMVDLRSGKAGRAVERIAPFLPNMLDHVTVGVREPYEMHLACHEILAAAGDARAKTVLTTTYDQLQANVNKVTDRSLLECFWQAPVYHKIRTLWQALND